jgi:hypothetical protein
MGDAFSSIPHCPPIGGLYGNPELVGSMLGPPDLIPSFRVTVKNG